MTFVVFFVLGWLLTDLVRGAYNPFTPYVLAFCAAVAVGVLVRKKGN